MKRFNLKVTIGLMAVMTIGAFNLRYAHEGYGNAVNRVAGTGLGTVSDSFDTAPDGTQPPSGYTWELVGRSDNEPCNGGTEIIYEKANCGTITVVKNMNGKILNDVTEADLVGYSVKSIQTDFSYTQPVIDVKTIDGGPKKIRCERKGTCLNPIAKYC